MNPEQRQNDELIHLRAAGVSVVIEISESGPPALLHWGADLGDLGAGELTALARLAVPPLATNGADRPVRLSVLPEQSTGWTGTPGLTGHRDGAAWATALRTVSWQADLADRRTPGGRVQVRTADVHAQLEADIDIELLPTGLLRSRAQVRNTGSSAYDLEGLALTWPLPTEADEVLDLAGRWARERSPQRRPLTVGAHLREGRHGRTGADAALVTVAGRSGFGFRHGEAWGMHVAWSGNHRSLVERLYSGEQVMAGGELLLPGEVSLAPGESYVSPWVYGSYGIGLDAIAARFHEHLRAREHHPRSPRPVVLNVWEAVYFDHDLDRLRDLADRAAAIGVERYVLDDGWFRGRRDDSAGLGDWFVDEDVWPEGLTPLVEHVHALGMEFGLWFEPEMINLDSDLARQHPDWVLQVPGRLPVPARQQHVLDVAHPQAWQYLLDRIVSLVREYRIDYLKWDHNRDLIDAGSPRTGRASVHEQTLATYRLLDAIREQCPGLEIESCSSGGARVDLEILERTDRVWASDCIDAHERQQIQRWTAQLLPAELVGSHVGAGAAHTTGRQHSLGYRAGTALFGHFGIEWDLAEATAAELTELADWVALYREHRELLHAGSTVRMDPLDECVWVHGVIAADRRHALLAVVVTDRPATWPPGRARIDGLDPQLTYRLRPVGPSARIDGERVAPPWWDDGATATGAVLAGAGIQVPALLPDELVLLHVEAVSTGIESP